MLTHSSASVTFSFASSSPFFCFFLLLLLLKISQKAQRGSCQSSELVKQQTRHFARRRRSCSLLSCCQEANEPSPRLHGEASARGSRLAAREAHRHGAQTTSSISEVIDNDLLKRQTHVSCLCPKIRCQRPKASRRLITAAACDFQLVRVQIFCPRLSFYIPDLTGQIKMKNLFLPLEKTPIKTVQCVLIRC